MCACLKKIIYRSEHQTIPKRQIRKVLWAEQISNLLLSFLSHTIEKCLWMALYRGGRANKMEEEWQEQKQEDYKGLLERETKKNVIFVSNLRTGFFFLSTLRVQSLFFYFVRFNCVQLTKAANVPLIWFSSSSKNHKRSTPSPFYQMSKKRKKSKRKKCAWNFWSVIAISISYSVFKPFSHVLYV